MKRWVKVFLHREWVVFILLQLIIAFSACKFTQFYDAGEWASN